MRRERWPPSVPSSCICASRAPRSNIKIDSGNFLKNSDVKNVSSRIAKINEQLFDELTTMYRGVLDEGDISGQGGAGLGFIDIARKSGNKIKYEFTKIDEEYCFFVLKINING